MNPKLSVSSANAGQQPTQKQVPDTTDELAAGSVAQGTPTSAAQAVSAAQTAPVKPQPRVRGQRLNDEQKRFLVHHNACRCPLAEVARLFEAKFGFSISHSRIETYDLNKASGRCLKFEYRDLFYQVSAKFQEQVKEIEFLCPIASKWYRLDRLRELFEREHARGNWRQVAKILEQAAKEMGNMYARRG